MKAVILAGGTGSGLYPLSRKSKPKQFHKFTNDKTLLQESYERVSKIFPCREIYVTTNIEYESLVTEQLPALSEINLLLEPQPKNTAAAIGFAASYLERENPGEIMAIFYTNHVVENPEALYRALDIAEKIVRLDDLLVLIEVNPTFPSDKLGYVKIGRALREIEGQIVFEFKEFVEKPTLNEAKRFLESWEYLWNTGFLVVKADKLLSLYKKYLPDLYKKLIKVQTAFSEKNQAELLSRVYETLDSISFDYGLMEKIAPKNVAVIPADLGWTDVRTWSVLYNLLKSDRLGNVIKAKSLPVETKNSLIFGKENKLIVTLGLEDVVVVDTDDVLFVGDIKETEKITKIVEDLEKKGKKQYL